MSDRHYNRKSESKSEVEKTVISQNLDLRSALLALNTVVAMSVVLIMSLNRRKIQEIAY